MNDELVKRVARAIANDDRRTASSAAEAALAAMDEVRSHDAEDDAYRRGYDYGRQEAAKEVRERCLEVVTSGELDPAKLAAAIRALSLEKENE